VGVKDRPKADRWGPQVLDIDTAWRMLWEAGKGLCCPPGVWGVGGSSAGNPVFDGPVGVSVIPSPLLVSGMELVRQRGRRGQSAGSTSPQLGGHDKYDPRRPRRQMVTHAAIRGLRRRTVWSRRA